MTATEQLKEEHKAVKVALQILDIFAEKLQKGQDIEVGDLEKILEFLKVFVDKCHHGKEEGLLFPAMEKAGIPKDNGPIGAMLADHDAGRNFIRGISDGLASYKTGDKKLAPKIVENITGYTTLLREHIDKEDNILYMMADMHLNSKEQEELLSGFEKLEQEKIGPGKHEEFHRLLDQLQKTYL